jgi:TetR/AcrR family transcriptional regulator
MGTPASVQARPPIPTVAGEKLGHTGAGVAQRAPRRERRKESRPSELIAAALDVFVERGYAATRLEDVAARAGVSKGTLYLYFTNKAELFKAVVRETIVTQIDRFREQAAQSDAPPAELLRRFFHAWWDGFGSTRLSGIAKLIVAEAGNFPDVTRFFHDEVIRPNSQLLAMLVERGVARGDFRPIDAEAAAHVWSASLVMRAIAGHSIESCCPPEHRIDDQRFLDTHIDLALAALAAKP